MFRLPQGRAGHYALLFLVAACLFLPGLGRPSLWDIDEGNNAECAWEMLDAGTWIVPTFNYQLRTDKPALLYWLQMSAYRVLGVNELAARLPSVFGALLAVLFTYELGRRLFDRMTGLLAGLVLASAPAFCAAAHFANPDALLNAFTVLTLLIFWRGYRRQTGSWFGFAGVSMGLAMLTKGPVGFVLPWAVILVFLLWVRQMHRLLDRRLLWGVLTFVLIMGPWYAWVGVDTRGEFLKGFFLKHNRDRFLNPLEGHGGPVFYYLAVLFLGLGTWSIFLFWSALRLPWQVVIRANEEESRARDIYRFLWCWIGVYLVFFTVAGTKLPNYILPLYPPVAVLTAHFLEGWRRGEAVLPGWALRLGLVTLGLIGVGTAAGFLLAGGLLGGSSLLRGRHLPGMETWAFLGVIPVIGAVLTWRFARKQQRGAVVAAFSATAVLFTASLAAGPIGVVEDYKAPRPLADLVKKQDADPEIRVAGYQYFQPSLVFYCGREVSQLTQEGDVQAFLTGPLTSYLFVPAPVWERLAARMPATYRTIGRHHDLYRNCDVVVVTNR